MKRATGGSKRTVVIALSVNLLVAVAKGVVGVISGSGVLLSEAAHSVADTLNEGFLFIALERSDRPADDQHPFGYGKERYFWSLLAAVGIFVAGAVFSFFQGYRTLSGSSGGETSFIGPYVVLGVAGALEGTSWLRAVRQLRSEARAQQHGMIEHIRMSDDPTVKTVASEDSAALVGVLIAVTGVVLHQLTGNGMFDGIASLIIGVLLGGVAVALGRDNMGLLIGESAPPAVRQGLLAELRAFPEVDDVIDLLTLRIGTAELLVAARLDFGPQLSSDEIELLSARIEQRIHKSFPQVQQVFLDPTAGSDRPARTRRAARESATNWIYPGTGHSPGGSAAD